MLLPTAGCGGAGGSYPARHLSIRDLCDRCGGLSAGGSRAGRRLGKIRDSSRATASLTLPTSQAWAIHRRHESFGAAFSCWANTHPHKSVLAGDDYKLWLHRDFKRFYSFAKKPSRRVASIDRTGLDISVGEYLGHPEFHTPYMDWVLIDALTFAEIVSTGEAFAEQKIGSAYTLADGSLLKLYGYKTLGRGFWLIGVAIGWGWPAAVVYLSDGHLSPWGMAGLAAYYALLLRGVFILIGRKIGSLFSREPSPIQRLEKRLHEMERTYHALGTGRISDRVRRTFDRAFENGVLWDPQILEILDAATRR